MVELRDRTKKTLPPMFFFVEPFRNGDMRLFRDFALGQLDLHTTLLCPLRGSNERRVLSAEAVHAKSSVLRAHCSGLYLNLGKTYFANRSNDAMIFAWSSPPKLISKLTVVTPELQICLIRSIH